MQERCPEKDGIVVGCRALSVTPEQSYLCELRQGEVDTCKDCMRCPKCGGLMMPGSILVMEESPPAEWKYKTCPLCSHYMKGEIIPIVAPQEPEPKGEHSCQVEGCSRKAFEHYRIQIGEQEWGICAFHKTQIYHWGYFKKGVERYPLMVRDGLLLENALYKLQGRRPK